MRRHIGDIYEGVISGVTAYGFYVELTNTVEGLVRAANLDDDYYIYDQEHYQLVGEMTGRTFSIGQSVSVVVVDADTLTKQIEFYSIIQRKIGRKGETRHGKRKSKLIANNKKAFHDYFIEDTWEAGIALVGTEVKSLRMGKCSLKESFIQIHKGEVFIYNMHISPYEKGNIFNKDPLRPRKLLVHRYEINKIVGKIDQKGYTLVPLQIYFKGSLVKVEFALAKGKSFMISVPILQRRTQEERLNENLRYQIYIKHKKAPACKKTSWSFF